MVAVAYCAPPTALAVLHTVALILILSAPWLQLHPGPPVAGGTAAAAEGPALSALTSLLVSAATLVATALAARPHPSAPLGRTLVLLLCGPGGRVMLGTAALAALTLCKLAPQLSAALQPLARVPGRGAPGGAAKQGGGGGGGCSWGGRGGEGQCAEEEHAASCCFGWLDICQLPASIGGWGFLPILSSTHSCPCPAHRSLNACVAGRHASG